MISYEEREKIKNILQPGDLDLARGIYITKHSREISKSTLYMFITGKKICYGRKKGGHLPGDMFVAISDAIKIRKKRERTLNDLAAKISASTIEVATAAAIG